MTHELLIFLSGNLTASIGWYFYVKSVRKKAKKFIEMLPIEQETKELQEEVKEFVQTHYFHPRLRIPIPMEPKK